MKETKETKVYHQGKSGGGGSAVYGLGLVGAAIFYVQQANGFWPIVGALIKALVWPAFMVHDLLKFIS